MSYLKRPYDWHDAEVVYKPSGDWIIATVTRPIRRNVDIGTPQARCEIVGDAQLWQGGFKSLADAKAGTLKRFPKVREKAPAEAARAGGLRKLVAA